jgi:hypothetical protein
MAEHQLTDMESGGSSPELDVPAGQPHAASNFFKQIVSALQDGQFFDFSAEEKIEPEINKKQHFDQALVHMSTLVHQIVGGPESTNKSTDDLSTILRLVSTRNRFDQHRLPGARPESPSASRFHRPRPCSSSSGYTF